MSDAEARSGAPADAALAVVVGGTEFAVPVRHVREVLRLPPVTRVPFTPPAVRGVVSVRGSVVPVLDLGARLLSAPGGDAGRLVVVTDPLTECQVGLLVDEVRELVAPDGRGSAPPAEVEASLPPGWIAGVLAPAPGRLVTLLNLEPVLMLHDPGEESE